MKNKPIPTSIKDVKPNPLANYKKQIEPNNKLRKKRIGETNLAGNELVRFAGFDDEQTINFYEDLSAFEYSKVVTSAKYRDLILSFKPSTQSLFIWILFQLKYRCDTVEIPPKKIASLGLNLTPTSLTNAILELEDHSIIKRQGEKRKDYWIFNINPQYMFKGDAKQFYKDVTNEHPEYLSSTEKAK